MFKVTRSRPWVVVTLCLLGGGLLFINGRSYLPVASGQSYPDWECAPMANPCTTCSDTENEWQCILNLNGWDWGGCYSPIEIGCYQSNSSCGDVYDCEDPPVIQGGSGCSGVFDICAYQAP
jgi:hypothetical protein